MTDTIEAVARAVCAAHWADQYGQTADADTVDNEWFDWQPEAQAAITAHTKALIEGAGELVTRLRARARLTDLQANQDAFLDAAATIAAMKAEIERLTRHAALSDLIAGDADLIVPDTLADSDGDDGA